MLPKAERQLVLRILDQSLHSFTTSHGTKVDVTEILMEENISLRKRYLVKALLKRQLIPQYTGPMAACFE